MELKKEGEGSRPAMGGDGKLPTGGRRTRVCEEFSMQIRRGRMGRIFHVEEAADSERKRK